MSETSQPAQLTGLERLLRESAARPNAPVESWDPPFCGDIGLAIRGDGTWTYRDSPINRMPLVKLFAKVLRRDPDGQTYLVTPAEKVVVTVGDAPFVAVEMEVHGEGHEQRLIFRTNVDDVVTAGPQHPLTFQPEAGTGGTKPYVRVRGRLDALVSRAVTYDLLEMLQPGAEPDTLGIWSGGIFFTVETNAASSRL